MRKAANLGSSTTRQKTPQRPVPEDAPHVGADAHRSFSARKAIALRSSPPLGVGIVDELPPSSSPAITRAAAILSVLASQPLRAFGPSELSRKTGIPKSSILNICTTLSDVGFLRRDDHGVRLHRRLAELGNAYLRSLSEIEEFYEVCRLRLPSVPQTVQLSVLGSGLSVVVLARHDGCEPLNLGRATETGRSIPAHCTAIGKALLAALDEPALKKLLPRSGRLRALTPKSITTTEHLESELADTRKRGYAKGCGEFMPGRRCFAIAIRTPHRSDGLIGISFSFPEAQDVPEPPNVAAELRSLAAEFAERIGGALAY